MARPRRDNPPDKFTTADMEVGTGMSQPNIILLSKKGLVPDFGSVGMGSYRVGNIRALKHVALIGAIHKTGVEPTLAAKLTAPIARELEAVYYEIPSNLDRYIEAGDLPFEHREGDPDSRNDFWFHHLMVTRTEGRYHPGLPMVGDWIVEVADRQWVYLDHIREPESIPVVRGVHYSADPLFRVIGWERGGDQVSIVPFNSEAADKAKLHGWNESEGCGRLQAEYFKAYAGAVGRLRINMSLAIRNALDAIHAHRIERRETVQSPPMDPELREESTLP